MVDSDDAHGVQRTSPPSFCDGSLSHAVTAIKLASGQAFTVHTDLLCYWSPKLRAMLAIKTRKELQLDLDAKIFGIIVHWLYTAQLQGVWVYTAPPVPTITTVGGKEEIEDPENFYRQQAEYRALEIYIFATTYDIKALRNETVREMHKNAFVVSYAIVLKAYQHLPPTSLLLKYFVDQYARNYFEELDSLYPGELVLRKQLPNTFLVSWLLQVLNKKFEEADLVVDDYLEPM
ncbi:hypothetical protein SLS58_006293 [Diplodia intermedia]|uniref:BTB domain-containing protein n=1 Tax=Diplodia intermedia TaxID=856260 RepID=A0ABR3TND9_9PEZI